MTRVVLVTGPPCSGKNYYVEVHAQPEDVVVDFDAFSQEHRGIRYDRSPEAIQHGKRRWLDALDGIKDRTEGTAWVIWAAPTRTQRGRFRSQYGAEVVVIRPPIDVCLERVRKERPAGFEAWVHDWYRDWEPSHSGQEVVITTTHTTSEREAVGVKEA